MKTNQTVSSTIMPVIGMGATIYYWSDKTAATIIQITQNGKRIVLQEDRATRMDKNGVSEIQTYSYQEDPQGKIFIATLRKDGTYRVTKTSQGVSLGQRYKYHDYSF